VRSGVGIEGKLPGMLDYVLCMKMAVLVRGGKGV